MTIEVFENSSEIVGKSSEKWTSSTIEICEIWREIFGESSEKWTR